MLTYMNPLTDIDGKPISLPDPHVLKVGDTFHFWGTQSSDKEPRIRHYAGTDLNALERQPDATNGSTQYTDTNENWAPSVIRWSDGTYMLYYVIRMGKDKKKHPFAIALATGSDPYSFAETARPVKVSRIMLEDIDPFPFEDPRTSKRYLYFGGGGAWIRAFEIGRDGYMARKALQHSLIRPVPGDPYRRMPEGVCVYYHAESERYIMLVSGSDTFGIYGITAYAAEDPLGPFEYLNLALQSGLEYEKPGQASVLCAADGAYYCAYHAIDPTIEVVKGKEPARILLMEPVHHLKEGSVLIGRGTPSQAEYPVPV